VLGAAPLAGLRARRDFIGGGRRTGLLPRHGRPPPGGRWSPTPSPPRVRRGSSIGMPATAARDPDRRRRAVLDHAFVAGAGPGDPVHRSKPG
jgi:hypothetical protein